MPEGALDKKYQRYGRDILTALIDGPTAKGCVTGRYMPYVRFEMDFPSAVEAPQPAGKFADMVRGRITPAELYKGNEVHDMAYAIARAVEGAIKDDSQQFTVEAVVGPARENTGTQVNFFIYSESHRTPEDLQRYLGEHRQNILSRYAALCGSGANLGAA